MNQLWSVDIAKLMTVTSIGGGLPYAYALGNGFCKLDTSFFSSKFF
ncbi:MAG: hypothetical protein ACOC6Q_02655 [Patescibacteria group bacterium]